MYVNVGAKTIADKKDIPTKAALKRKFAENPDHVLLYETTMGNDHIEHFGDSLDIGVKYSVTGPNPYTNRKWYATVEKGQNGRITVK